jgi:hypothetical protein
MFFIKGSEIRVTEMVRERPLFFSRHGKFLYAFGSHAEDRSGTSYSKFGISDDMGETWHDLTEKFTVHHYSNLISWYRLPMLVSWMEPYKGRLYCDLGGGDNIAYSEDNGFSWTLIQGEWDRSIYRFSHLLLNDYLYMGGEAPLDDAWIWRYKFSPDGLQIISEERLTTKEQMGNRNVMELIYNSETSTIFAGAEGAILRSRDGERFTYSLSFSSSGVPGFYPYFKKFGLSGKSSKLIFSIGSRRGKTCSLFYSDENGAEGSWRQIEYATTATVDWPQFLHELPNGDILVGTLEEKPSTLNVELVELTLTKLKIETDLEAAFPSLQYTGDGFWKTPHSETVIFGKHQPYLYLPSLNSWCFLVSVGNDEREHYLWSASLGWLKVVHEPFTYLYSYRDSRFIDLSTHGNRVQSADL